MAIAVFPLFKILCAKQQTHEGVSDSDRKHHVMLKAASLAAPSVGRRVFPARLDEGQTLLRTVLLLLLLLSASDAPVVLWL